MLSEQLKAISYFQDLDARALEGIRANVFEVRLEKGYLLFT